MGTTSGNGKGTIIQQPLEQEVVQQLPPTAQTAKHGIADQVTPLPFPPMMMVQKNNQCILCMLLLSSQS